MIYITLRTVIYSFLLLNIMKSQEFQLGSFSHLQKKIRDNTYNVNNSISIFGPNRFNEKYSQSTDSLNNFIYLEYENILSKNINIQKGISFGSYLYLNRHIFLFLNARIVSDHSLFPRFTGLPREISRFGFNSGETDLAGIGFQNKMHTLQFGRGRQSWGAGNDIKLIISESSSPYEYFMYELKQKYLRARYFHGFLERIDGFNRYINGKGVEYYLSKKSSISLSEIVIYSGLNRSVDFAYFNPVSSHLEIELNDRQNYDGTGSGNAAWQFSIDSFIKPNIRFSFNYVIDEFVIDQSERRSGKVNLDAYSTKLVYSADTKKYDYLNYYLSFIKVGTHTFRHESISPKPGEEGIGFNNFSHRNLPLGWDYGSDGYEIKLGINVCILNNFILKTNYSHVRHGSNSLFNDPYGPYSNTFKTNFPSGTKKYFQLFSGIIKWKHSKNLYTSLSFNITKENKKSHLYLLHLKNTYDFNF